MGPSLPTVRDWRSLTAGAPFWRVEPVACGVVFWFSVMELSFVDRRRPHTEWPGRGLAPDLGTFLNQSKEPPGLDVVRCTRARVRPGH
ncbi:hypothetical protein GCM10022241_15270 [Micrococcus endophyticus]